MTAAEDLQEVNDLMSSERVITASDNVDAYTTENCEA